MYSTVHQTSQKSFGLWTFVEKIRLIDSPSAINLRYVSNDRNLSSKCASASRQQHVARCTHDHDDDDALQSVPYPPLYSTRTVLCLVLFAIRNAIRYSLFAIRYSLFADAQTYGYRKSASSSDIINKVITSLDRHGMLPHSVYGVLILDSRSSLVLLSFFSRSSLVLLPSPEDITRTSSCRTPAPYVAHCTLHICTSQQGA